MKQKSEKRKDDLLVVSNWHPASRRVPIVFEVVKNQNEKRPDIVTAVTIPSEAAPGIPGMEPKSNFPIPLYKKYFFVYNEENVEQLTSVPSIIAEFCGNSIGALDD